MAEDTVVESILDIKSPQQPSDQHHSISTNPVIKEPPNTAHTGKR